MSACRSIAIALSLALAGACGTFTQTGAQRGGQATPAVHVRTVFRSYTVGSTLTYTELAMTSWGHVGYLMFVPGTPDDAPDRNEVNDEGYAVCAANPTPGEPDLVYGATTLGTRAMQDRSTVTAQEPNGQGALPITFTRRTIDDTFEVQRTFTLDPWQVHIRVVVRNLAASAFSNVRLAAYLDTGRTMSLEHGAGTTDQGVFAWTNGGSGRLLSLIAPSARPSFVEAALFGDTSASIGCEARAVWPTPSATTDDYRGMIRFNLGTLGAGASMSRHFRIERQ